MSEKLKYWSIKTDEYTIIEDEKGLKEHIENLISEGECEGFTCWNVFMTKEKFENLEEWRG